MTSRKAIASQAPKTLSPSSSTMAYMVHIDWTSAAVVKVTARKALKLVCQQVAVVRGHYMVQRNLFIEVPTATMLHFVASDRGDGWYYVVSNGACSCPAHHFQKGCEHLMMVEAFVSKRDARGNDTSPTATFSPRQYESWGGEGDTVESPLFSTDLTPIPQETLKAQLKAAQQIFWMNESKASRALTEESRTAWTVKREIARAQYQRLLALHAVNAA